MFETCVSVRSINSRVGRNLCWRIATGVNIIIITDFCETRSQTAGGGCPFTFHSLASFCQKAFPPADWLRSAKTLHLPLIGFVLPICLHSFSEVVAGLGLLGLYS
jgi:hypothetical protein